MKNTSDYFAMAVIFDYSFALQRDVVMVTDGLCAVLGSIRLD